MDDRPVVVFGASGPTGGPLVRGLVRAGRPVRGVSRRPGSAAVRGPAGVDWVPADLGDARAVAAAVRDAGAVVMASGTRTWFGLTGDTGATTEVAGMAHVLSGLDAFDPDRTVPVAYLSTLLVTRRHHPAALGLDLVRAGVLGHKAEAEDALRASGRPHLILRPGLLADGAPGEQALYVDHGDRILGRVRRADVAATVVSWLQRPDPPDALEVDLVARRDGLRPAGPWDWEALWARADALQPGA